MRLILPLLVAFSCCGAYLPPAERMPTATGWQGIVGVPGGIPNRAAFTNLTAGATAGEIGYYLAICPSNQAVVLGEGVYNLDAVVSIPSGVSLRGSGTNTVLNCLNGGVYIYIGNGNWYDESLVPVPARHQNVLSGLDKGSTNIILESVGDLAVGRLVMLDQLNDTNTEAISPAGYYTSVSQPNSGSDRVQVQMIRVTAIDGTTVTVSEPIQMSNWSTNQIAQLWWYNYSPVVYAGLENLTVCNSLYRGVAMQNCYACWVTNVNFTQLRFHVNTKFALRCEITGCKFTGPPTTTDDYALDAMPPTDGLLVQNNRVYDAGAFIIAGVHGSVFAYNYLYKVAGGKSAYMAGGHFFHGGHPTMNLFEGNVDPGLWLDRYFGSSAYNTGLRNRWLGRDVGNEALVTSDIAAVKIASTNRFVTLIGNVLGTTNVSGWYEDSEDLSPCHDGNETTNQQTRVYFIGRTSQCWGDFDAVTLSSLIRHGNYSTATNASAGTVWIEGEADHTIPNSLYLAGKPSWWGAGNWPSIGSDLTPMYSAIPAESGASATTGGGAGLSGRATVIGRAKIL